jgi:ketosteroid isomerase-like protein
MRVLACIALAALLSACASPRTKPEGAASRAVIENYLAALNRRDLLALTAYVTPDFEWVSMVDGERIVEVESREALAQTLRQHFARHEFYRWGAERMEVVGGAVAVTEYSEWRENEKPQSRTALGVFELTDGRIRRVTYFLAD